MLDSDATTGTRRGPGAPLSAKRMTAKERKALRAAISARLPERKAATEAAAVTAEEAVAEIPAEVEALQATVAAQEAEAKAAAAEGEAAANLGAGYQRLGEIYGTQIAEARGELEEGDSRDVNDILAEFYARIQADAAAERRAAGESAYNLLFEEFSRYGLGALVEPLRGFIEEGLSPAEFTIKLRGTDAYRKRFAANAQRINKGLRALSEAEYIELEDQYQNIMRQYGLPDTYYTRGEMGRQEGFEKFIGGDVSPVELEERIQIAQRRVQQAPSEVMTALTQFYGNEITNGDVLAYALDPDRAIENIKRKVTAAEIGGAAMAQGLATGVARAEELGRYGVTAQQAREGFQTVAAVTPRAGMLADIYAKQGLGPYTQATAEQEVFGLTGSVEAERKRRKLTELEQASFAGSSGMAQGALARERAGSI